MALPSVMRKVRTFWQVDHGTYSMRFPSKCWQNPEKEPIRHIFAGLAGHPKIHLICSIDHINAPLILDQRRLSKLNFIWFDCTTFLPYRLNLTMSCLAQSCLCCREETGSENSLMTRQSGGLQLASLTSVWPSLTPNAKRVIF